MVANLFRKTNLSSLTWSFSGIFLLIFFFHTNQRLNLESLLSKSTTAFVKAVLVFVFILLLSYFKNRDRYLNISPLLALTFPLVLLFIPRQSLHLDGILMNGLVLIAFLNLESSEKAKNVLKPLFNSALITAALVFLEPSFSFLLFSLFLFFFKKNTDLLRVLTALVVPFLAVYFLLKTTALFYGFDVWSTPWPARSDPQEYTRVEFFSFLGFVLLIVVLNLFSKSSLRKIGLTISTIFLSILILSGAVLSVIEKEGSFNLYEIYFFPLAYYLSIAFEEQSNAKINTIVILLLVVKAVSLFF